MRDSALEQALAAVGGASALARRIGVSQPAVSSWSRVPAERVLAVEAATGVSRRLLRPDLYEDTTPEIDPVDAGRADLYGLIANLLWAAPDAAGLARLGAMAGDGSAVGLGVGAVAAAARGAAADAVAREHFDLFMGVGGGVLMPYASYYLTGFLHERPLAEVRGELAGLGMVRAAGVSEPEDHVAFLCETMALLIRSGGDDAGFFARHLGPWIGLFFRDLEAAEGARFYRSVGTLGRVLIELELAAFALPA